MRVLLIACGTYDGAVFALAYLHIDSKNNAPELLEPVLLDPGAHSGPVTAIAVDDPYIVSGSTDEAIQVFSVPDQMRLGSLELHSGTIRHLEFSPRLTETNMSHLFSASDDGCIAIWRQNGLAGTARVAASSWECIRVMRRHKGPVLSLAIHPSQRCAYSISEDKTFRIWNLLRGRQAYATRLKQLAPEAEGVLVSPSGRRLLFLWTNRFQMIDQFTADSTDKHGTVGSCLAEVVFHQAFSAPPVFFNEDDFAEHYSSPGYMTSELFAHVLVGLGPYLTAFRCPLVNRSDKKQVHKAENFGEVKLPGKRIKVIQVAPWPKDPFLVGTDSSHFRSRLVIVATTEASCSHIRGYVVNMDTHLNSDAGLTPLFVHDVSAARVTTLAVRWTEREDSKTHECET